jgi:phenylalanyl-tRNA synthetase beta chain
MSEDHSVLRTTLLGSLLDAARLNVARGSADLSLVEQGAVYLARDSEPLPYEHRSLGLLLHGRLHAPSWGAPKPRVADFFAAKGLLEALLDTLRVGWWCVEAGGEPFTHPGRAAQVIVGGENVGWLGELHPLVAQAWDLGEHVAGFELDLDRVVAAAVAVPRFRAISSFPPVRQDLAVVVPEELPASSVLGAVREAGGALLTDVRIFDVYRGEQIGEGRASLAVALTFQAPDRTLTDDDVAPVREKIVAALAQRGGELRG